MEWYLSVAGGCLLYSPHDHNKICKILDTDFDREFSIMVKVGKKTSRPIHKSYKVLNNTFNIWIPIIGLHRRTAPSKAVPFYSLAWYGSSRFTDTFIIVYKRNQGISCRSYARRTNSCTLQVCLYTIFMLKLLHREFQLEKDCPTMVLDLPINWYLYDDIFI